MRPSLAASVLLAVVALLGTPAARGADDDDAAPFRAGRERRTWKSRTYDLIQPKDHDGKSPLALAVVILDGGGYAAEDKYEQMHLRNWERFVGGGWAACIPKSIHERSKGDSRTTSETAGVAELARHVATRLAGDDRRIHFVASSDVTGFALYAACARDAPWRSVCFDGCVFNGGSLPERLKSVGTLVTWDQAKKPADGLERLVESLRAGARSVDVFPTDLVTADSKARWWFEAMDGRVVPGRDHSLAWADAPADAAALAAATGTAKRGALVWFHSAADKDSPAANALQTEVFFDRAVRDAAAKTLAFRAPLDRSAALSKALGVTTTPALVVVDAKGAATKAFTTEMRAADLAKALRSVAGK